MNNVGFYLPAWMVCLGEISDQFVWHVISPNITVIKASHETDLEIKWTASSYLSYSSR